MSQDATRETFTRRPIVVAAGTAVLLLTFYLLLSSLPSGEANEGAFANHSPIHLPWSFESARDQRNLGLSDAQCDAAFPGLFADLERARDWHNNHAGIDIDQIKIWTDEPDFPRAQIRVLLHNGLLRVVGDKRGFARRERVGNALSNLYRAINAIPDPRTLPNIEFTIDTLDDPNPKEERRPGRTVWAWDRHTTDEDTWVMPDFDGWSYIGSASATVQGYGSFRDRVYELEEDMTFSGKTPKALWRGTVDLSNSDVPSLRMDLIAASKDKEWSDVQEDNFIEQVDHCKWQYLIHTEGYAWSGRLRYLMNCNSVSVIPNPLHFIAHFYPLLVAEGPEQNYIPVATDWSDLDNQIKYYLAHPEEAEAIANRSVSVFRDRYLTPAAEACYLRRMITTYASVQNFEPQLFKEVPTDFESGQMKRVVRGYDWEYFSYREPCNGAPDWALGKDGVDFED